MPQMTDAMYCHQQICIPPTLPYLLRQYAKAAIRTQPGDLLRWSAAYFRALAVGTPTPVKSRLEFPLLRTQYGVTPGWLKVLVRQFAEYATVTWPQLHDRWCGACLDIQGLLEIIGLAEFPDPAEIPWFRFLAVAAGFLTKNLTSTMILLCELLTEEPEGGSASIPYSTFADLYNFLARLDASESRTYFNYYYTISNLALQKRAGSETGATATSSDGLDQGPLGRLGPSQPDLTDLQRYLDAVHVADKDEEGTYDSAAETQFQLRKPIRVTKKSDSDASCYLILDPDSGNICKEEHLLQAQSGSSLNQQSVDTIDESLVRISGHNIAKTTGSEEAELVLTRSDVSVVQASEPSASDRSSLTDQEDLYATFREVVVAPVPGIGPPVSEQLISAVLEYMDKAAKGQQGMVMPRNIRHFLCPPLEECLGE